MTFHRWFAGFFLLILMVVALFVNSLLFSARSFQDNLAHIAPKTGGVIKMADLDAVGARIKDIENQTAQPRGELDRLQLKVAAAQKDVSTVEDNIRALEQRVRTRTEELETAVGLTPSAATGAFDPEDIAQRLVRIGGQRGAAAPANRETISAVRTDLAKLPELEQALSANKDDLAVVEAERDRASEFVAASTSTILGIQSHYNGEYERVRNEAQALMASTPFGLGQRLVEMHPTFLSTILVLIMGALGALLYLFPAYLNRENRIFFADIVVRLVFGMVVALAFYIVANASIASLAFMPSSDGSMAGASLNPFSVSLIGIVAGIMADDIASWILKRGRELLGGGFDNSGSTAGRVGGAPYQGAARDAQATTRPTSTPSGSGDPPRGGVVG